MKLEKIKLSGFKSFVDQTVIPIGSTITAIVGPNGCGKSNIIDAVRWVMGETSAKHLRGGNMTDVIFNGCATRKPVSVATVELIFDNSAGKIGGEYSQYAKLAIKRQVSRDGQSLYALNGNRCRRKDITDLFLGTGLGSRSYAIIEQGTISRMVEAKPDELRVHIEEAAGISKYKERRYETQMHISHTRENLQRLTDLRTEVAAQVKQLQKQAEKAEKYVALKKQQRLVKLQLTALRWQTHQQLAEQLHAQGQVLLAEQENLHAAYQRNEQQLTQQRAEQKNHQQQCDVSQEQFYQLRAKVEQLAQTVAHEQQNFQQLEAEIKQLQQQQAIDQHEHQQELAQLAELKQLYVRNEGDLQTAQQQQQQTLTAQQQGQQQQAAWQQQWQLHQTAFAQQQTTVQVQQAKLNQLQLHSQQLQTRLAKSQQELNLLSNSDLSLEIEELAETMLLLEQQKDTSAKQRLLLEQQIQQHSLQIKQGDTQLHQLRSQQQTLTGKMTSLTLLQQHALGKDKQRRQTWLIAQGLETKPPLAAFLHVDSGWEQAVEIVLGDYLAALCLDSLHTVMEHLATLNDESLVLFEMSPPSAVSTALSLPRLLDKMHSVWDVSSLVAGVYCVESLATAEPLRKQLKSYESIITQEGIWLGRDWLKLSAAHDPHRGVLQREQQLRDLKQQQQAVDLQVNALEQQLEVIDNTAKTVQQQLEQLVKTEKTVVAELAHHQATQRVLHSKIDQQTVRIAQLNAELAELTQHLTDNAEQIEQAQQLKQHALIQQTQLSYEKQALEQTQCVLRSQQQDLDIAAETAKQQVHHLQTQLELSQARQATTLKQLERLQQQQTRAAERINVLQQKQQSISIALSAQQRDLIQQQAQQQQLEILLQQQRLALEKCETAISLSYNAFLQLQQAVEKNKQEVDNVRFAQHENQVRQQTITEQFNEQGIAQSEWLHTLPVQGDDIQCKQQLEQLTHAIEQLGMVNLNAIADYKSENERLDFLTHQQQDLIDGLDTLEQAIAKIDRETRLRFKETFDKINTGLQEKFPKLFGGGQAYLELTQQNLLESGVSIIARPPGKKNSSIHLLSGGEKALTAVALVFSIFELNPAPFCLLDEVDAPLDDANVGRFSKMVAEMSQSVQFLFISHNKVTMEIAQQLTGVTMNEPGVSRMVAVNIEEAVQLAEG